MRRRTLLAGAIGAWPLSATAQPKPKPARIGFIEPGTREANGPFLASFRAGMAVLGWTEGQDLTILDRWVDNRPERLPEVVASMLAEKPDLLVTAGSLVTRAVVAAALGVPIVMIAVSDPIGSGFAQSLARPGGNVTGTTNSAIDLQPKRLQLLLEMVPTAKHLAVLFDSNDPIGETNWRQTSEDARKLGLSPVAVPVATAGDIEREIPGLRSGADALFVAFNALTVANRTKIAELALAGRLPTSGPLRDFVLAGALQSLGVSMAKEFRRGAAYVDKILRGAKPADLPIEQPTVFELAINLKTAKALGLSVPPSLVARADEVIE